MRPQALDLYCCGGGASEGLRRAGFDVLGVDIQRQPEYPLEYWVQDVLTLDAERLQGFDLVWASPPCQAYSIACRHWRKERTYVDLVVRTRELLQAIGLPYVIENVPQAPIRNDLILDGDMFQTQLRVIRKRIFEIEGFKVSAPPRKPRRGLVKDGYYVTVAGHGGNGSGHNYAKLRGMEKWSKRSIWQHAMGIDWLNDMRSLREAVPPAYSEWIGQAFLRERK